MVDDMGYTQRMLLALGLMWMAFGIPGCTRPGIPKNPAIIEYAGSSTIGRFMEDAGKAYPWAKFILNTEPESYGSPEAVLSGAAEIGGVAGDVAPEVVDRGIVATMIGKDAIAVIVNKSVPVSDLSSEELRGIFRGEIKNWKALGGPDLPLHPLIVGKASATRAVFRSRILKRSNYGGCKVVEPDEAMIERVRDLEGSIGQISLSFLQDEKSVKPVKVDGQEPSVRNINYPIFRPLYLLTKGQPKGEVSKFVRWVLDKDGQAIVMKRFVGVNVLTYIGSSTIGNFILDAQKDYGRSGFLIDTEPESAGGLRAALKGTSDISGVAGTFDPGLMKRGVVANMIGRDAIAVIVNSSNPVTNLSAKQLRAVFTGNVGNWKELGGLDVPVEPFIVEDLSSTREIFREKILGQEEYSGCETVKPDKRIIDRVSASEGAIGQISMSFLKDREDVRPLMVDGEDPAAANFDYAIFRPLYLMTKGEPRDEVKRFIEWTLSREGQRVVMQRFSGVNTIASVGPGLLPRPRTGILIIYTETYEYEDGGTYYNPHYAYDIYDLHGNIIRHVPNHLSENDERPATVALPSGKYLIIAEGRKAKRPEVFVTIAEGRITEVSIEAILRAE